MFLKLQKRCVLLQICESFREKTELCGEQVSAEIFASTTAEAANLSGHGCQQSPFARQKSRCGTLFRGAKGDYPSFRQLEGFFTRGAHSILDELFEGAKERAARLRTFCRSPAGGRILPFCPGKRKINFFSTSFGFVT